VQSNTRLRKNDSRRVTRIARRARAISAMTAQTLDADAPSPPAIGTATHATDVVLHPARFRNLRMMHLLERIAGKFNELEIPVMALKGAALNLTVYDRPEQRPMADLDLMVRVEDLEGACASLEGLGGLRGQSPFRDDFFPRFHYELEYNVGTVYPVKVDLHVRPFRPLRYAQLVPPSAFWERAEAVTIGSASILIPFVEDMIIHLAVHAAVHGAPRRMWLEDIKLWVEYHRTQINWTRFLSAVEAWRLALPVHNALNWVDDEFGSLFPQDVSARLERTSVNWRDRLALRQAPRDAGHPGSHIAVNALCTPGTRFALSYLLAVVFPDRVHMADWYCGRHRGWLLCAHIMRWLGPVASRLPFLRNWFARIEVRSSAIHGVGVFATKDIESGEVIARYHGRRVDRKGMYVVEHADSSGSKTFYELTGKLKFLNHSCRPNAAISCFELRAARPIAVGQEITIRYGSVVCNCEQASRDATHDASTRSIAAVA